MKKAIWTSAFVIAVCLCAVFAFVACGDAPSGDGDYTVRFDSQGGSKVQSVKVDEGSRLAVPFNPSKDNYYFDGWYVSTDENAESWNFVADRVTGNITLYAKWLPYVTVTFDAHNGEAPQTVRVPEGKFSERPITPERDGCDFIGWFKDEADGADMWRFDTDIVTEGITIHAHWQAKEQAATGSLTFERNGNAYTVTGVSEDEAVIVIPSTYNGQPVTAIAESAFAYSRHNAPITSVTIPDSVTTIERNAFYNRTDLVTVNIGESSALTSIGNNAFSGCRAIESIYVPTGVTLIGDGAFNNCGSLNSITVADGNENYSGEGNNLIEKATSTLVRGSNNSIIPETVTTIAPRAFSRATASELIIPVSVTTIGNYIISDSSYVTIRYEGTEDQWNAVTKTSMWNYGNRGVNVVTA